MIDKTKTSIHINERTEIIARSSLADSNVLEIIKSSLAGGNDGQTTLSLLDNSSFIHFLFLRCKDKSL